VEDRDLSKIKARRLSRIMDLGGGEEAGLWQAEELGAMLKHQLAAPLEFDFSFLEAERPPSLDALAKTQGPPIRTFGDLLHHPRPPLELLQSAKEFAKGLRSRADAPVPEEIATMLYLLSILVALTRCGRRITKLDEQGLRQSLDWALTQPWLDQASRDLLEEGYQAIEKPESEPDV